MQGPPAYSPGVAGMPLEHPDSGDAPLPPPWPMHGDGSACSDLSPLSEFFSGNRITRGQPSTDLYGASFPDNTCRESRVRKNRTLRGMACTVLVLQRPVATGRQTVVRSTADTFGLGSPAERLIHVLTHPEIVRRFSDHPPMDFVKAGFAYALEEDFSSEEMEKLEAWRRAVRGEGPGEDEE